MDIITGEAIKSGMFVEHDKHIMLSVLDAGLETVIANLCIYRSISNGA